jgi:Gly-Xaa carboxypeptidase
MPSELRKAILDASAVDKVIEYLDNSPGARALIRTSTAVDVVRGGEKGNLCSLLQCFVLNHTN